MMQTLETRSQNAGEMIAASSASSFALPSVLRQPRKTVIVQSGARDAYQVALALSDAGMLDALVTDLFWPADRAWTIAFARILPRKFIAMLRLRSDVRLPSSRVRLCAGTGLLTLLLDKLPSMSLSLRRRMARHADATLGRTAGKLATRNGAGLISYSYYAYDAFQQSSEPGILFQLHPHPASMRRILLDELERNPECAASLQQEWELSLPDEDFQHLLLEPKMAAHFLVASSFTKQTLVENGAQASAIRVIPYGVDTSRFFPVPRSEGPGGSPLRLLFVGRINQRKGIKYLLDALRSFRGEDVHLTVCGRVVDGLELFQPFASQVDLRPSVSAEELVAAYQSADLFVFPSLAEGFGQVLLEALASGLPILSTTRTAAPDLIEEGIEGWVVEPGRPDLLVERIEWARSHREELAAMGQAARRRAQEFTWARFRAGIVEAVSTFQDEDKHNETRSRHV